jgi:hypothetical protein
MILPMLNANLTPGRAYARREGQAFGRFLQRDVTYEVSGTCAYLLSDLPKHGTQLDARLDGGH